MKGLINCRLPEGSLGELFPDLSPYLLPIAHKPLLTWLLEAFKALGVDEILLVLYGQAGQIRDTYGDGRKMGVKLTYSVGQAEDSLTDTLTDNAAFLDQDVLIGDGFIFPWHFGRDNKPLSLPERQAIYSLNENLNLSDSLLAIPHDLLHKLIRSQDFRVWVETPLDYHPEERYRVYHPYTLTAWYELNQMVLNQPGECGLRPATSEMAPGATLTQPVLMGPKALVQPYSHVIHSLIGSYVQIETGARLEDCVVLNGCFVPEKADFKRKIIYRTRVIDPHNEHSEPLLNGVTPPLPGVLKAKQGKEFWVALLLVIMMTLPYLLLRRTILKKRQTSLINQTGQLFKWVEFIPGSRGAEQLFFRLHLDRFPLLIKVLQKQLYLTGHPLLPATSDFQQLVREIPFYFPAAFSEALPGQEPEYLMGQILKYCHHASPSYDRQLFWRNISKKA